jgi:hypothetical protein
MEMISNTTDTQRFCVQVAADRGNVSVHARSNVTVQPWFAILGAEDNVNDDIAERLRHCGIMAKKPPQVNRAVSANEFFYPGPGASPQAGLNAAPLALKHSAKGAVSFKPAATPQGKGERLFSPNQR